MEWLTQQQNGSMGVTQDWMMKGLNPVPNYDENLFFSP